MAAGVLWLAAVGRVGLGGRAAHGAQPASRPTCKSTATMVGGEAAPRRRAGR